jgi:hypothetical protein
MPTPSRTVSCLIVSVLTASCSTPEPTVDDVRAATEKYRDVAVALADGYVRDPIDACETPYHMGIVEDLGVMGIHYFRPDLLGVQEGETRLDATATHTDFLEPAILVYEPQADGSLELVALANLLSADAWQAAGHSEPPSFADTAFELGDADPGMMVGARYELHAWLFRDNPRGMFAAYNPNATCEHHEFNMPMIMPPDMPHH